MDTKTGKIYELTGPHKNLTELTPAEYAAIAAVPEEQRPMELALLRFLAKRKSVGASCGLQVRNAFRLGYQAAVVDQKGKI